ncbi:MAG: glycoside hydrolase family 31 protein, partial [Chitinispirillaceae bacterium]|nr:glycoside hydrolase family 31 protein [Chitinispirillaceae bacterium]
YTVESVSEEDDGVVYTMSDGSQMKVQVCTDAIIRVVYTKKETFPPAVNAIVVKDDWSAVSFTTSEADGIYTVLTAALRIDVARSTGAVSFATAGGAAILQETAGKTLVEKTIGESTAYEGTISFNSTDDEGIYGFGQFQNGVLNQKGLTLDLVQKNQADCSPVFLSTRGFGVLLNNFSRITVSPPLKLVSEWATNDAIDYYFMYGPEFDRIISAYRTVTGPAPMWPKWAYGFWQCKNRYLSQFEMMSVVQEFRSKGYPLDNIVQDWQYYPDGMNGSGSFDRSRFPDPKGMIDSLHDIYNCHYTISIWPSYAPNMDNTNWSFMNERGYLLPTSDYLGQTYDPFNDSAAYYYWKFIEDSLVTLGVDGFWPDATEPESFSGVGWPNCVTAQGPSTKVLNAFPLLHSKTLYEGFRKATGERKRVCNLTRSYYAGSQRLGAAYWTGDIDITLASYVNQIPAGLNVCATGLPYFCTDIGGFTGETDPNVLVRWFQYGTFNPVFRIHGTRNTELWMPPQQSIEAIMVKYCRLRYRLFPYVYSLAWKVTNEGYTMMRALPFDFRNDTRCRDLTDEFMFGPAFLVCPITNTTETSRQVYLPEGNWYDFWTGEVAAGGATITAQAPQETMPLYIREGSILPMGPQVTYAAEKADPIELRVYTGADGSFTLYEDEGNSYDYEKGAYATTPIVWDNANEVLSIGPTSGSFPGMLTERTFNVVWVSAEKGTGETVTTSVDKAIPYGGYKLTLDKKTNEIGVVKKAGVRTAPGFATRIRGGELTVSVSGKAQWKCTVYGINGRCIARKSFSTAANHVIAERLVAGVYVMCLQRDNELVRKTPFIIQ